MMKIYILTWMDFYDENYPFENSRGFLTMEKAQDAEMEYMDEYETYIYEVEVEE